MDTPIEQPANDKQHLNFRFDGDGTEYFKIWIVNILLSIITLGIYSAWATVRNNQYFYSNTYLDDSNFKYLANPISILKGRIIAVVAFIAYSISASYSPTISIVFIIALFISMPYFFNKSIEFKMRMSAYKNIQFRFKGSYGQAVMVLFVWPILGVLSLGILMPMSLLKMNQYVIDNSTYGTSPFKFNACYKDYAMIFLIMFASSIVVGLLSFGLSTLAPALSAISPVIMFFFYIAILSFYIVSTTNILFKNLSLVEHTFDSSLMNIDYIKVLLVNILLIIISLGLYAPAAKVRMAKYMANNIQMHVDGNLDNFSAAEQENISALGEEMGQMFDFA